jgi:hypothetical protein
LQADCVCTRADAPRAPARVWQFSLPLLLFASCSALSGAFEPENMLFEDYHWLASNWMFVHLGL